MSQKVFWSPNSKTDESGVSVYSTEDEKFSGWSSLPQPCLVRIAFAEQAAPIFKTSETADLVFTGTGDIRLFVPGAMVERCEYILGQTVYSFRVRGPQWENIRNSLSPRRSIRVRPDEPIILEVASAHENLCGEIEDLSESGLSVNIPSERESELLRPGLHSLRFGILDDGDPIEIMARLRYRAANEAETVRCGFEFEPQGSTDYRENRWRIARYVWGRQESAGENE